MKFVNLEKGIILNAVQQGNFVEFPSVTSLDENNNIEQLDFELIDDQLVVPLIILNKKGYTTEYSCSGHIEENAAFSYIRFVEPIFKYSIVVNPRPNVDLKNFGTIQIDEDLRTIRISNTINKENLSLIDINKYINEFCSIILQWSIELPDKERAISLSYEISNNYKKLKPFSEETMDL